MICRGDSLTLTTRGSGWHFSSWSSKTCTGPPLTMLPPRKIWMGRSRAERKTVVGGEDIPGRAPHWLMFPTCNHDSLWFWPEHPSAPISAFPAPSLSSARYFVPSASCLDVYFLPPSLSILLGPHLSRKAGPLGVRDVVLSQVPVQPVAEVEKAVVQGEQDVSDQAWG